MSTTNDKSRSCVICAQRKVRCDKRFPCSRCLRAGIQCVQPVTDNRPRWVRNLGTRSGKDVTAPSSSSNGTTADQALTRLKRLEGLVKELSGELEHAREQSTATASQNVPSGDAVSAGRMIRDDSDHVSYVSNGFWARIDSELDKLKELTRGVDSNETEDTLAESHPSFHPSASDVETNRTPSYRNAFLFKNNITSPDQDTSALLPLPSQIPFLLEVYAERVQFALGLPHLPTFKARLRQSQTSKPNRFSPSEEALVFSVYYATIGSMDDEEVNTSFNTSKSVVLFKYRTGLEYALAKADFLSNPNDVILQALNIFLALARRHESPKFAWMMAGLAIRMARYLGIHHDGSKSKHIKPFQIEMQRRIWSDLCALDLRVTEDQGTELGIPHGSYTTQRPSNINDTDIWPEMKDFPQERNELTNITLLRLCHESAYTMQDMSAAGSRDSIEDHERRINSLRLKFDREYFSLVDSPQHPAYAAMAGTMRVILARLTLLTYPPILYSSPGEALSMETRTKLLIAAIEIAEHNHALNSDASCRPWRWIYQTQQHWHAVIYILLEICRRPWTSTLERAWIALQSPWLVPVQTRIDRGHNLWAPVRRLMTIARTYRGKEIARLRNNAAVAAQEESVDQQQIPVPASSITFPDYFNTEMFRERWRRLVQPGNEPSPSNFGNLGAAATHDHTLTIPDTSLPSLASTVTMHDTPFSHIDSQLPSGATTQDWNLTSAPEAWMIDLTDSTNLDAFLNVDTDMSYLDEMNIDDVLSFDWNGWFESTKGVL